MPWHRPLSFVYGNCVLSSSGPWALFALEPCSYASLTPERKREHLGRLMASIEALEADIQILRVAVAWDPTREFDELARDYTGPHPRSYRRYLAAQVSALSDERAELPGVRAASC